MLENYLRDWNVFTYCMKCSYNVVTFRYFHFMYALNYVHPAHLQVTKHLLSQPICLFPNFIRIFSFKERNLCLILDNSWRYIICAVNLQFTFHEIYFNFQLSILKRKDVSQHKFTPSVMEANCENKKHLAWVVFHSYLCHLSGISVTNSSERNFYICGSINLTKTELHSSLRPVIQTRLVIIVINHMETRNERSLSWNPVLYIGKNSNFEAAVSNPSTMEEIWKEPCYIPVVWKYISLSLLVFSCNKHRPIILLKKVFRVLSRVVWFCFRRHRRFEDYLCLHHQGCWVGVKRIKEQRQNER
jgi:hypothetical protein